MDILIALFLGMIVGGFIKLSDKGKSINGKLQQLGVVFLLFSMGASIGVDEQVIKELPIIGFKAFLFAVFTIGASIILVYALTEKFMVKKKEHSVKAVENSTYIENGEEI